MALLEPEEAWERVGSSLSKLIYLPFLGSPLHLTGKSLPDTHPTCTLSCLPYVLPTPTGLLVLQEHKAPQGWKHAQHLKNP